MIWSLSKTDLSVQLQNLQSLKLEEQAFQLLVHFFISQVKKPLLRGVSVVYVPNRQV